MFSFGSWIYIGIVARSTRWFPINQTLVLHPSCLSSITGLPIVLSGTGRFALESSRLQLVAAPWLNGNEILVTSYVSKL